MMSSLTAPERSASMDDLMKVDLANLLRQQAIQRELHAAKVKEPKVKIPASGRSAPNPFLVDNKYALTLDEVI